MFLGEQAAEKHSYASLRLLDCAPIRGSCSRVRVRLEFSITCSRTRSRGFCLALYSRAFFSGSLLAA